MEIASDRDVIEELQRGSLDALGILYDRYQRMVFRTALAITGDGDAAADLLQDVFLRLHRFAERIDASRPLEPWLYRMTANLSYTWIKRHSRWIRSLEEVTEWFVGGKRPSPSQQAEDNDEAQKIRQAIVSLPFPHRVVVVLYYIDDLSVQEISEILDVPVGTVKSRLHYGRQALKEYLGLLEGDGLPAIRYEFT